MTTSPYSTATYNIILMAVDGDHNDSRVMLNC